MIYNEVKHTKERVTSSFDSTLEIQRYGSDNLYPQEMYKHISASGTGGVCLERYAAFIEGNGFDDKNFAEFVCNKLGETNDDILHLVGMDLAKYNGFAIHVNYDGLCRICSISQVPFECCRLEEENESGQVVHIAFHPDWRGKKTRKGKTIQVNKKNITWYYQFNPNKNVVASQIAKAGGIERYTGQILWVSFEGKNRYPKPIYDKIITNLSTDEGLDNVKYRNVRNNFLPSGMLIRRNASALTIDDKNEKASEFDIQRQMDEASEALKEFMGDENTGSMMEVYLRDGEGAPEWQPIEGVNFDKKFDSTSADVAQRIYSAFGQEPWYSLRIGKTGFSGGVLADAYDYYNSYVALQRRYISRAFQHIYDNWKFNANRSKNFEIEPLVFIRQKWANLNQPVN